MANIHGHINNIQGGWSRSRITLVCTALVHMGDKSDEVIIKNTQECKMIVIETTLELSWTANIGPFQITLGCEDTRISLPKRSVASPLIEEPHCRQYW